MRKTPGARENPNPIYSPYSNTHSNGWPDMLQRGSEYLILNFYVLFILKFFKQKRMHRDDTGIEGSLYFAKRMFSFALTKSYDGPYTHVKTRKLLHACKQVVTMLFNRLSPRCVRTGCSQSVNMSVTSCWKNCENATCTVAPARGGQGGPPPPPTLFARTVFEIHVGPFLKFVEKHVAGVY